MNRELTQLTNKIKKALPTFRRQYSVRDMWLFGSYVHDKQTADSDLDVLVTFDNPTLSLIEFIQLEQQLSELLGVSVDLIERETLKPDIGKRITQEAIVI